jgi:Myb/SANT-like DNA-binding protein
MSLDHIFNWMEPTKGKKAKKFTEEELSRAVKENEKILFGQFSDTDRVDRISKSAAWRLVLNAVNAVGEGNRSLEQVKIKMKNVKMTAKKIESNNRREIHKTGGGKANIQNLSESQRVMLETVPEECIEGVAGGIDLNDMNIGMKIITYYMIFVLNYQWS